MQFPRRFEVGISMCHAIKNSYENTFLRLLQFTAVRDTLQFAIIIQLWVTVAVNLSSTKIKLILHGENIY